MLSSTFNSDFETRRHWWKFFLWTSICLLSVIAVLELGFRQVGFKPNITDDSQLWALTRSELDREPESIVVVGSSRSMCDINLGEFKVVTGREAKQLAIVGTGSLPVLENLAASPNIRGTVICEVSPDLFFLSKRSYTTQAETNIRTYQDQLSSLFGFSERRLSLALESRLVLLSNDVQIEELVKMSFSRRIPEQSLVFHRDRSRDYFPPEGFRQVDVPYPTASSVSGVTPYQESIFKRAVTAVTAIQERGGKVIFIYLPCRGPNRARELSHYPQALFWDPLLAQTGAFGVHATQDSELSKYIPQADYSHLSHDQALKFTRRLAQLLEPYL